MKFLLDVNASGTLADWLKTQSYDVRTVREVDARMTDDRILAWAVEENRILVTTDQDFEEMIWQEKRNHAGVVRLENLPRAERIALFQYVLAWHVQDLMSGAVLIASSRKIRVRRPGGKG